MLTMPRHARIGRASVAVVTATAARWGIDEVRLCDEINDLLRRTDLTFGYNLVPTGSAKRGPGEVGPKIIYTGVLPRSRDDRGFLRSRGDINIVLVGTIERKIMERN
jgi:hypothetical protein